MEKNLAWSGVSLPSSSPSESHHTEDPLPGVGDLLPPLQDSSDFVEQFSGKTGTLFLQLLPSGSLHHLVLISNPIDAVLERV